MKKNKTITFTQEEWNDVIKPLIHIGGYMSNICFNLKQDSKLPETTRQSMGDSQMDWDNAQMNFRKHITTKKGWTE